jgi:hypothetical protein
MPAARKNSRVTIASRPMVWVPPRATAPSVSSTTIAAISRQTASSRPSSRRSLDRSRRERSVLTMVAGSSTTGRDEDVPMSPPYGLALHD